MNSITGQNLHFLMQKFNKVNIDQLILDKQKLKNLWVNSLPEEENWKVNLIEEISLLKKNQLDIEFDPEQLETILDYVCTD